MAFELYIEPERKQYNPTNGQFLKGHIPHNKGKKWSDYMDMRKAKRIKRAALKNLHGRKNIGGWNAQPIFAIDKNGETIGWFASSSDAERKVGICARNIRSVLEGKRKYAGGYKWIKDYRKCTTSKRRNQTSRRNGSQAKQH